MAVDYSGFAFPKGVSRYEVKATRKQAKAKQWDAVCAAVDARDARCCRVCGKPSRLDATGLLERGHRHHIIYRSAGGPDLTWNLCHLCARHHHEEHTHQIRLSGDADAKGGIQLERLTEAGWRTERFI